MSTGRSAGRSGGRATRAERAAGKTDTAAAGSGDGTGSSQNHQEKPAKSHTHHSKLREEKVYEDKISQVVQLTGKTKDEAEIALYDCDYDPTRAINMLLEGDDQGEWVEKTKKKKPPKPSPPEPKPQEESFRPQQEEERGERDRSRGGRGGSQPPRLRRGAGPDRSWKARESRENEKNAAGVGGAGGERTRWGRGGARGGRGGRRGGLGSRSFQGRSRGDDFSAIDTWTNPGDDGTGGGSWDQSFPSTDDWDNEEWAGSLSDTKVFTPSTPAQPPPVVDDSPTTAGPVPPPASSLGPSLDLSALLGKSPTSGGVGTTNGGDSYSQFSSGSDGDSARSPPTASSAPSASAAYSYSNATARSVAAPQSSATAPAAASYPSGYTNPPGLIYSSSGYTPSESYQSHVTSSAPSATATTASQPQSIPHSTGRTRVNRTTPKIPESAVEMPSDLVSSLEVKFGGLDFFSADGPARRVNIISPSTGLPVLAGSEGSGADGYSSSSQSVSQVEQTSLPLSSASQTVKSALEPTSAGYSVTSSAPAAVPSSASSFPPAPGLYSSPQKSSAPAAATSSAASSAPAGFPPAPSVSGATFAQLSAGYSGQVTAPGFSQAAGFPSSNPASSSSPPSAFSQPSAVSSAFPGSGSFASSSYSGAGAGAYNGGSYTSGTLAGTSLQEKLTNALSGAVKASQYDPSSVAMSVGVSTAASSLPAGLTNSAANSAANSVQNSAGRQHPASTRSGNMPSVPPGVPMQYFVGQGGMPTFYPGVQQIYGYEDMQALQQRLPHLQQQAAAQQAAGNNQGRGDATSALAAAMADASKYSRDASSPIQSSLNQQVKGQQQQQPFFNAAAAAAAAAAMPPNYTYFPFVPQYSIYTPMPPATNAAHQASSGGGSQYPKMAYNAASFAGSSYDTLASAPGGDYKAAAAAGPFGGSAAHKLAGSGSVAGGSADLYGKVQQLGGKYDNKGFHAATPPPFGLAGGQPQQQPLAAPGGYAPHLFIQPLPAQHQLVHPTHAESAGAGGPQRANAANKPAAKNSYGGGYWPAN